MVQFDEVGVDDAVTTKFFSTPVLWRDCGLMLNTPAIVTSGPYQNVSGPASTGSAITWLTGTTATQITAPENLAMCQDALGLVMVPLEIPQGVDFAARETYRNISMRVIRAYDINNDVFPTRIDILYGTAVYYDELACRLGG